MRQRNEPRSNQLYSKRNTLRFSTMLNLTTVLPPVLRVASLLASSDGFSAAIKPSAG